MGIPWPSSQHNASALGSTASLLLVKVGISHAQLTSMDLSRLRIRRLEMDETRLLFTLVNGMRVDVLLSGYPALARAKPALCPHWQLTEDGYGVNWPDLAVPTTAGLLNILELLWKRRIEQAQLCLRTLHGCFDMLTLQHRELIGLDRLDMDMSGGGFARFFDSRDEATRTYALQALDVIGAHQLHQAIVGLNGLFGRLEQDLALLSVEDIIAAMDPLDKQRVEAWEQVYYAQSEHVARLGLTHYGLE